MHSTRRTLLDIYVYQRSEGVLQHKHNHLQEYCLSQLVSWSILLAVITTVMRTKGNFSKKGSLSIRCFRFPLS